MQNYIQIYHWFQSYGNFSEQVDFACWWSCIGKSLSAACEAGLFSPIYTLYPLFTTNFSTLKLEGLPERACYYKKVNLWYYSAYSEISLTKEMELFTCDKFKVCLKLGGVALLKLDRVALLVSDTPEANTFPLQNPRLCLTPTFHRHYGWTNNVTSKSPASLSQLKWLWLSDWQSSSLFSCFLGNLIKSTLSLPAVGLGRLSNKIQRGNCVH